MSSVVTSHYHGHRKRLRERFLHGPGVVPDYELLELLLFASSPRGDVKPLAKTLIAVFGSFRNVVMADVAALRAVGLNDAGVAVLKGVHESVGRCLKEEAMALPEISSHELLLDYLRVQHEALDKEQFRVLFLNKQNRLISDELLLEGTVDHAAVYPREIIKKALDVHATALILVHNHPSGALMPSAQDLDITKRIVIAASSIHITVLDHIIVAKGGCYSFQEHGKL